MGKRNDFSVEALEEKFDEASVDLSRLERARFERALSWLRRGDSGNEDCDVRVILRWVALDAMFGREADILLQPDEERVRIPEAVAALMREDRAGILWEECRRKRKTIARILRNPYIYNPFWRAIAESRTDAPDERALAAHPKVAESRRWFARENRRAGSLAARGDAASHAQFARIVFARLATLRNQLMHGASAHAEGLNRSQVEDGERLLSALAPRILHLMMDSPRKPRGVVAYPPFGDKDALFDKQFDEARFYRQFARTRQR